jgi:hypothetical protein
LNKSWDDSSKQIQANPSTEMKNTKSQSYSRSHLLAKLKKEAKLNQELNQEKKALAYTQRLPDDMINEIRSYLCGVPREIIEKEMERKRRKCYIKILCGLPRWHFADMLNKIDKKQLIQFVLEGSVHKYPELVKRFRLHIENTTYEGETFIEKWRKNEIPTKYESLIPIIISEQIRYFIPSYSKQVKHMDIQEINAYIHLYKSVAYMVKMKSTEK